MVGMAGELHEVDCSQWIPLPWPLLVVTGSSWVRPPQDESMGETLPRSLERWGRTACKNKILCWGRAFLMGCLEKGAKVVKAREQVVLRRSKYWKTEMGLVLFEFCSLHRSSQHSLSCLAFKLCF